MLARPARGWRSDFATGGKLRPWATATSDRQKLTDEPRVAPLRTLARWGPWLGEGYKTRSDRESQELFAGGGTAIYPSGSREIAEFMAGARFAIGAFRPPAPYLRSQGHGHRAEHRIVFTALLCPDGGLDEFPRSNPQAARLTPSAIIPTLSGQDKRMTRC